jgi:phosphatidate phosphatase LPIN
MSERGVAIASTEAYIYLWSALDSVIVSDIDGTVTKDNVGGVMDTVVQDKFSHIHKGICKFYQQLTRISPVEDIDATNSSDEKMKGQVRFMYLSSRPISLVAQTRKLLVSVSQTCEENLLHSLPPGPMMCNVVPLSSVLYSELVAKTVHQFKSDVLARQVVLPFVAARGEDWRNVTTAKSSRSLHVTELDEINETNARCFSDNFEQSFKNERAMSVPILRDDRLFLAGFGNTMRDAMAYEMAGMDRNDIYIIDPKSRIMCMGEQVSRNQSIEEVQFNNSECLDTEWISDVVDGVCCGVSEKQDDESLNGKNAQNSSDAKKASTRAVFDEPFRDHVSPPNKGGGGGGLKKSKKLSGSVSQSIRAFTNKKSFNKFPSFSSTSSKSNSSKKLYQGYDDPRLLDAVRRRMQCSDDEGVNSESVQRMTV